MSEDYYESESESGTESAGDEYFYEDDSEEELEGGAYQLATDYIDGMGYGHGGVLMGGAKKKSAASKNCISNYNLFFKKYRSAPHNKTPTQIGKMWREGKGRMPARKAPKGRKLCKNSKRPSVSGSKKSMKRSSPSKKKKSSSTKKKVTRRVNRGTFCPENARWYKTKRGYDNYCGKAPFKKLYFHQGKSYDDANTYYWKDCGANARWCPLTKTCRKQPESILDCYNRASIPYYINDNYMPTAFYPSQPDAEGRYPYIKDQYALADAFTDRKIYTRGHLVGAKKKTI